DNGETTVISKNIVISGGTVTGFANVRIDGSVQGDIRITKDVNVTGKVVGDIECNNAVMAGSAVQGSVSSKGQLRMDRDSVLLGDVNTQYLDMNGRIKGTVDVTGKAEFKSDSVVIGDITASTITVLDGAVIKGFVNTTFLQDNSANVFPDTISVSDE
ncbi:MAG: polymer-forming cytoskeletal protein, partial [Oscillospiraceae bacterium]